MIDMGDDRDIAEFHWFSSGELRAPPDGTA
jgi:hypothetical protein